MSTPVPATQEWTWELSIQQQTVLLAALRGPDGVPKFHPCKVIARAYRSCVIKAASLARAQTSTDKGDTFMNHALLHSAEWTTHVRSYFRGVDEMPHHYHLHLLHAAEILGYKHPDEKIRLVWWTFYMEGVEDMHLMPESEADMDSRLDDFGRLRQRLSKKDRYVIRREIQGEIVITHTFDDRQGAVLTVSLLNSDHVLVDTVSGTVITERVELP